jgi:hypothetical protein
MAQPALSGRLPPPKSLGLPEALPLGSSICVGYSPRCSSFPLAVLARPEAGLEIGPPAGMLPRWDPVLREQAFDFSDLLLLLPVQFAAARAWKPGMDLDEEDFGPSSTEASGAAMPPPACTSHVVMSLVVEAGVRAATRFPMRPHRRRRPQSAMMWSACGQKRRSLRFSKT